MHITASVSISNDEYGLHHEDAVRPEKIAPHETEWTTMKLSTRSRYGARILVELAKQRGKGPVQISTISQKQQISVKYLEQLMGPLKKAGMVASVRGPKGGHRLDRDPSRITLGEVVRLFEGQADLVLCVNAPDECAMADTCRVRSVWKEATRALYESLDKTTIADLVDTSCPDQPGV